MRAEGGESGSALTQRPLLKDIGLRRVKVGYEFPTLFWHRD
jgi:hypothetical protein